MRAASIVAMLIAEVVSWRVVARSGRANEWNLMIAVFLLQGVVALLAWGIDWSTDAVPGVAIAIGLVSGAVLYVGTLAFVAVAARVPLFRAHVVDRYDRAALVRRPLGIVLALLIAVPGEELFWRGFVQGYIGSHSSELLGAALAWVGYVCANTASGSLPFIAAAVVGGLVWGGLTLFTGGILAAVICHGVWTGLMLAFPPRAGWADMGPREMMSA